MANHTIPLTASEESIYQKYLSLTALTEAMIIARLKAVLTEQVIQTINEKGAEKFYSLTVDGKIAFLE